MEILLYLPMLKFLYVEDFLSLLSIISIIAYEGSRLLTAEAQTSCRHLHALFSRRPNVKMERIPSWNSFAIHGINSALFASGANVLCYIYKFPHVSNVQCSVCIKISFRNYIPPRILETATRFVRERGDSYATRMRKMSSPEQIPTGISWGIYYTGCILGPCMN